MKIKKITALLLAAVMILAVGSAAAAYTPQHTGEADVLNTLGLFRGTGSGYELDRATSRAEALVMLTRLLGKESEALSCTETTPFEDVKGRWMESYVAWAYSNNITKGMSESEFGPDIDASAKMFITFVLRALGYSEEDGDFTYAECLAKAAETGLISSGEYAGADFYRDDCVAVSYSALSLALKGEEQKLIEKLVAEEAVTAEDAVKCGLINDETAKDPEDVKVFTVACIGDSLTYGEASDDPVTQSYPAVLAGIDGKYKFVTEKYGRSGATVDFVGFLPYGGTDEYKASLETEADIVLIMLGTNDTVFSMNRNIFPDNYTKLVQTYIDLPCKPQVIVMLPPHFFSQYGADSILAPLIDQEKQVAEELGLEVIDVFSFTENRYDLGNADGVHFSVEGYKALAEFVYDELSAILDKQGGVTVR